MNPTDNQSINPQQQVIERLRTAINVLVTVSNNPSVDQLSAAIGFTLFLNKLGKHATTVFSGTVPSTIEFLKPEETIEKNTDSLRDFIVSLDKSKADKLRYKVEQNVVKIFITPYHTSISEKDLEFSQGDFNVDAVLALGVQEREQLDQAITAHGRILHDATVITVSAGNKESGLGAINWHDAGAASLCEMLISVGDVLQPGLIDAQQATAFLTGIVAETDRFSNEKTTPKIMSLASQLMAAGANQQLIATQLDKATEVPLKSSPDKPTPAGNEGSLTIEHKTMPDIDEKIELPAIAKTEDETSQIAIDEHGNMTPAAPAEPVLRHRLADPEPGVTPSRDFEPPQFSANMSEDKDTEVSVDPLTPSTSDDKMVLSHTKLGPTSLPPVAGSGTLRDIEMNQASPHIVRDPTSTLNEIEEVVDSAHLNAPDNPGMIMTPPAEVDAARSAVSAAIQATPYDPTRPEPLQALNSSPLSSGVNDSTSTPAATPAPPAQDNQDLPTVQPVSAPAAQQGSYQSAGSPPPVPPPMMPLS